ncbi:E3 ubiquitin-protein ligase RBBP6-like [Sinocyclocheilus anshuiensis]|uniref:E3 ubiquitin-protein ligase RBBP6-like n=1 Tax=Sinocyclocheilus anshuiensis TaxID=1608454 RepID=UPI0007B9B649|nr:PREDICTED: E3 ubiquitin-protein ligase RBBP6-like [Sinocyclocheilus anshuiensis]
MTQPAPKSTSTHPASPVHPANVSSVQFAGVGHLDGEAYAIRKKEKPPFSPQNEPSSPSSSDPVPTALLCLICKDLLTDAVMIPCCSTSYCDECIRTCLLESDGHLCPTCRQSDVSPDALTANTVLRQEVNHFRNGTRSLRPNHSRRSRSPIPEYSSKRRRDVRENRSHSRSPLNRYTDQKRPETFQSCIGETL